MTHPNVVFTPPPPMNLSDPPMKAVLPYRWEHLAGPFSWCEFVGDIEAHDEFGYALRVRTFGGLGAIAQQVAKEGDIQYRTMLISGPKGIGKTALESLLVRTKLATRHEPVTMEFEQDDTKISFTLIDHITGQPFNINPPIDDPRASLSMIQRLMTDSNKMLSPLVWYFNSGPAGKAGLDAALVRMYKSRLASDRQCFVFSEFDVFTKAQVKSLKTGLDPSKVPSEVLFIADTNEPAIVRDTMTDAGWDRFELKIDCDAWSADQISDYAKYYCTQCYDIKFDPITFQSIDPYKAIGEACHGSFRAMLSALQVLRGERGLIVRDILDEAFNVIEQSLSTNQHAAVAQFIHSVTEKQRKSPKFIGDFIRARYKENISMRLFVQGLSSQLVFGRWNYLLAEPAMAQAIQDMLHILDYAGDPIPATRWAALARPLLVIAEELAATTEVRAARPNSTRSFRA